MLPSYWTGTPDEFDARLRDYYQSQKYGRKEDQPSVTNCAIREGGKRCNSDATGQSFYLWLDQDDAVDGITQEAILALLPDVRMAFYPTYSAAPGNPKWRCKVTLSRGVSPKEQGRLYKAVFEFVLPKDHNLDTRAPRTSFICLASRLPSSPTTAWKEPGL